MTTASTAKQRPVRRRPHRRRSRGFSLVEVMIATAVFALIAGVLFSALWGGQQHIARLQRQPNEAEQLLALRRILSGWLESATVAGHPTGPGQPVFRGDGDTIQFHATPGDRGGLMGLYRIDVRLEPLASNGTRVTVRRQRLRPDGREGGAVEAAELLRTPRTLRFAFFDVASTNDGSIAEWSETWAEPSRLPVRIQLHDGAVPLLTAGVAVAKDARCILRRGPEMMVGGECTVR
jgi:general secretion pathway protein J